MKHFRLVLVLLVLLAARWSSAEVFQEGDKVCFLGDSITHGGRFHYMIYDYYVTRFPDRMIDFFSAGVSGDTAGGSMGRLEEDVFVKKPNVIAIMFGMNDVGRGNYVAHPTEQQRKGQENAFQNHQKSMARLLQTLDEKLKPKFILITPSPFNDTGENDRNNNQPGCNAALGRCAANVKAIAGQYKAEVVDFHAPMTALDLAQQKKDIRWTIVGPDRVHPGAPGHLMMAWLFLKEQKAPSLVSSVALSATDAKVLSAANAVVSEIKKQGDNLEFTVLEKAIPFPIDPAAEPVLTLLPIVEELNQETLKVVGLTGSRYELAIDSAAVGTYSAAELSKGINLAMNAKTPQYQQGQKVRTLSDKRRQQECILRNYAAVRWYLRRRVDVDDMTAVMKFYDNLKNKTGYFEAKVPGYVQNWSRRASVIEEVARLDKEIRQTARPVSHRYTIKPESH